MENRRVTIYDIAREMNIAASTVTRALNGKKGVGQATRRLILQKAEEMGYRTNLIAKSLQRKPLRIGVIVNDRMPGFHALVLEGAKAAAAELADFNVEGEFVLLPSDNLRMRLSDELRRMQRDGMDGVIFVPGDAAAYDAEIRSLAEAGVSMGTVLVSCEHPAVAFSVYPDSARSGRLAADLFSIAGMPRGAQLLIAIGSAALPSHRQVVEGFRAQCAGTDWQLDVLEHGDDSDAAYSLTRAYLETHPDLQGVYCATAITAPVCRAARDSGRNVKLVGTEITAETAGYLRSGTLMATLFQDPVQQGRRAFRTMYEYLEGGRQGRLEDICIHPAIVTPGNLDLFGDF